MPQTVPDELLALCSELLTAKTGLYLPPKRWPDLARGLAAAARDLGCDRAAQCAQQLLASPLTREKIEILASHLTVGETYFFREKRSLAVLENHILPELIRDRRSKGRQLRIWSAGCASGEEAYTIAILLHRLLPDLDNWQIHLLATDINPLALQKAVRGQYTKWSFRDTPPEIIEQYFTRRERHWEILPRLKRLVNFTYLNLAEDSYPSLVNQTNAMDLILCRNVLMYFSSGQARRVLDKLARTLVTDGWLIVSLTETSVLRFSPLTMVHFPEAIAYRKAAEGPLKLEAAAVCPAVKIAASPTEKLEYGPVTRLRRVQQPAAPVGTPPEAPPPEAEAPAADEALKMAGFARSCADQGDLSAALSWCEQALAADRLNPAWHYLKAAILQEQDAVADAVHSLRRAVYLDQDFVMGHLALGNLALKQADHRAARRHFRNVLALLDSYQPDDPLPESEGITAGRLKEIVHSTLTMRKLGEVHATAG